MNAGAAAPPAPGERLDPARARAVLLILSSMALMVTYVETMVVPAIKPFHTFFDNAPFSLVAWIVSAYLLVGVAVTPVFGKLGDIYGKKRMLVVVLSVYAVAVTIAGFTPDIARAAGVSTYNAVYLLIAVRGVQGVGLAMFPLAFAMIGEEFPPKDVATAQGVISAMFAAGAAIGLVGGAYLTSTQGWRFTYRTVIPFAYLILALAIVRLRESRVRLRQPIDVPGSVFLGVALGAVLAGLSEAPTWGWTNWAAVSPAGVPLGTPTLFVLSALFAAAFLLWEPRIPNPIVDFARLKEKNIAICNVVGVVAGAAMFLMFFGTSLLVQLPGVGLNQSVFIYGISAAPTAVAMMVFGPLLGKSVSKFGPKPVMILGCGLIAVGGGLLTVLNRTLVEIALSSIPLMLGVIACFIAMTNVIVLSSRREETGIQTGMNATFRTLGQSVGPVVAATILASLPATYFLADPNPRGPPTIPVVLPQLLAFQYDFLIAAVLGGVCLVLALFLTNYRYLADGSRVGTETAGDRARSRPAPADGAGPAAPGAVALRD